MHPCLQGVVAAEVQQLLSVHGLALILEITTGGDYTPNLADGPQHLEQLEDLLGRALALEPFKINLIIGDTGRRPHSMVFSRLYSIASTPFPVP